MVSHDLEDSLNVIDGREEIVDEVARADAKLRDFLVSRFAGIVGDKNFGNTLPGLLAYDEIHAERVARVRQRMMEIAGLGAGESDGSS